MGVVDEVDEEQEVQEEYRVLLEARVLFPYDMGTGVNLALSKCRSRKTLAGRPKNLRKEVQFALARESLQVGDLPQSADRGDLPRSADRGVHLSWPRHHMQWLVQEIS